MIILKQGYIPEPEHWWVGIVFFCPNCNCVAKLEPKDCPLECEPMGGRRFFLRCPNKTCDELIYFTRTGRALDFRGNDITVKSK